MKRTKKYEIFLKQKKNCFACYIINTVKILLCNDVIIIYWLYCKLQVNQAMNIYHIAILYAVFYTIHSEHENNIGLQYNKYRDIYVQICKQITILKYFWRVNFTRCLYKMVLKLTYFNINVENFPIVKWKLSV